MLDVSTKRVDWVIKWPGQIVLAVNMARWTAGAEEAIINGASKGQGRNESPDSPSK